MPQSGMALALTRFDDLDAFEDAVMPFLLTREAEHNLFIGICGQIREGRYDDFYLAAASDERRTVRAAAFRTPPFQLTLSHVDDPDAIDLIAADAFQLYGTMPGAAGGTGDAKSFATAWKRLTGADARLSMQQRIYQATTSNVPGGVPGQMRDADGRDRDVGVSWFHAFHEEVGGIMVDPEQNVDLRLRGGTSGLVLWWDEDRPVSLAGFGAPTPNGVRVGPVYTPPDLRGRGYATACVAELTRRLLTEGRRFVFLYTDLANPTSNSIYQKIGYRPVADVDQYLFVDHAASRTRDEA
jgi:predicted GNAT family acetyltransferase